MRAILSSLFRTRRSSEPDPREAGSRAVRARSRHSSFAGAVTSASMRSRSIRGGAECVGRSWVDTPCTPISCCSARSADASCRGRLKSRPPSRSTRSRRMAQWAQFSRLRAPFYLYVPPNSIDAVRRCAPSIKSSPQRSGPITWRPTRFGSRWCIVRTTHLRPSTVAPRAEGREAQSD